MVTITLDTDLLLVIIGLILLVVGLAGGFYEGVS